MSSISTNVENGNKFDVYFEKRWLGNDKESSFPTDVTPTMKTLIERSEFFIEKSFEKVDRKPLPQLVIDTKYKNARLNCRLECLCSYDGYLSVLEVKYIEKFHEDFFIYTYLIQAAVGAYIVEKSGKYNNVRQIVLIVGVDEHESLVEISIDITDIKPIAYRLVELYNDILCEEVITPSKVKDSIINYFRNSKKNIYDHKEEYTTRLESQLFRLTRLKMDIKYFDKKKNVYHFNSIGDMIYHTQTTLEDILYS